MTSGGWITDPNTIKQEAAILFEEKYKEVWPYRPLFRSSGFHKLSEVDARFLEGEFSLEEIENTVWSNGGDKSPGQTALLLNSSKNTGIS